jgi:hypothetical protein
MITAVEALRDAQAVGISVKLDGEGLVLEADREPPQAVLDALGRTSQRFSIYCGPANADGHPINGTRTSTNVVGLLRRMANRVLQRKGSRWHVASLNGWTSIPSRPRRDVAHGVARWKAPAPSCSRSGQSRGHIRGNMESGARGTRGAAARPPRRLPQWASRPQRSSDDGNKCDGGNYGR